MDQLISFICFWSVSFTPGNEHLTKATAENHFKNTKIENENNLKAGQCIDNCYTSIKASFKIIDIEKPTVQTRKKLKPKNEPDNLAAEKSWNRDLKNKKSKITYEATNNIK